MAAVPKTRNINIKMLVLIFKSKKHFFMTVNKKNNIKDTDAFTVFRVIKLGSSFYRQSHSELSQDELSHLQMLLFPEVELSLEEWNN